MTKIIKISDNKDTKTTTFVMTYGNKYIAFAVTHTVKPRIIGLTIPCTKQQLKQSFDLDIPEEL